LAQTKQTPFVRIVFVLFSKQSALLACANVRRSHVSAIHNAETGEPGVRKCGALSQDLLRNQ
jgi:hypothetical protein